MCDFYFSFYQTMFQRFKKMNIVKIIKWTNWLIRKQKNRLLIKCRKCSNKKINCWFIDKILIFHHDWLIDSKNKKINYWLSFSQIYDRFRWFTLLTIFFWFAYFYERFDDFVLNIRVFLRTMKILFLFVFFYEQQTIFFNFAYLYERLTILFNYSRISTSNLCKIWSNNR